MSLTKETMKSVTFTYRRIGREFVEFDELKITASETLLQLIALTL